MTAVKPRAFSWNDATVLTPATQDKPGPVKTPPPEIPADEQLAAQDRFTTIEEHERQQAISRELEEAGHPGVQHSTLVIAFAVVLLVAFCIWGLWPPSADALYHRIQRMTSVAGPADARRDIDRFLARFPHDPRFQEIDDLRRDVESDWLASRLRLRKRKSDGHGLEPFEERWLDAYHLQAKEPQTAHAEFESILAHYGASPAPSDPLVKVLSATRHQLKRLAKKKSK
jgi:serine/threonine-protein kinase